MPIAGWSDYLRLPWAHLYWNLRKSRWIARDRRGNCPCLNPSDPQGPRQARCDAVIHWQKPARFQRVCPLLTQAEGEWRCQGGRDGARPFWPLALRHFALLGAGLAVAAILSAQALLWFTGVRGVTPLDLALPHRWERVQQARADYFQQLALDAFEQNRPADALLAMATAWQIAPRINLDQGLALLRVSELRRQYVATDQLHRLLRHHLPDHARQPLDVAYHDALLISGRWPTLAQLCLDNLAPPGPETGAWLRSLALAARHLPAPRDFADQHTATIDRLPPATTALLRRLLGDPAATPLWPADQAATHATIAIEHAAHTGDTALAADAFGTLAASPDTFRDLRLQNRYRLRFPDSSRDPSALRLTLVDLAPTPASRQLLLADALRARDPAWLAAIAQNLPANLTADCAGDLWLAATVLGAEPLRQRAQTRLLAITPLTPDYFDLAAQRAPGAAHWADWITLVPCSREMLLTLAELRPDHR